MPDVEEPGPETGGPVTEPHAPEPPELRDLDGAALAKALLARGAVLRGDKHPEEAIAAWNRLVGRMGDAAQPAVRAVVAMALIDKGNTLSADLARHAEAITAYRPVVDLFGIDPQPAIRDRWPTPCVSRRSPWASSATPAPPLRSRPLSTTGAISCAALPGGRSTSWCTRRAGRDQPRFPECLMRVPIS
jgi:hypothetical protein